MIYTTLSLNNKTAINLYKKMGLYEDLIIRDLYGDTELMMRKDYG